MSIANKNNTVKFKTISQNSIWGGKKMKNRSGLYSIGEHEYLVPVGPNLLFFDNNSTYTRKSKLFESNNIRIIDILIASVSTDLKYLAAVVETEGSKANEISIQIYDISAKNNDVFYPRTIVFVEESIFDSSEKLEATCFNFSHDSKYFAFGTNFPSIGIIIYENKSESLYHKIETDSVPRFVTFNPGDSTRLCATGDFSFFKFWRISQKSVFAAPVTGIRQGPASFSCHVWIPPYNDGLVIAGSNQGNLCVVQGCELKCPILNAFESNLFKFFDPEISVIQILVRGDTIAVFSSSNVVSVFEITRSLASKSVNGISIHLSLSNMFQCNLCKSFSGASWCINDSLTSYSVLTQTNDSFIQFELANEQDGSLNLISDPSTKFPVNPTSVFDEKVLFQFHGASIQGFSLSNSSLLATSSFDESKVRIWDFTEPTSFSGCSIVQDYTDSMTDNPFNINMHPSGLFVAFSCENEVKEYGVSDGELEFIRKIVVKNPFTGPSGTPFMITQPVSLVKYSTGGQYLAVVTGKIVQIFHSYLEEDIPNHKQKNPSRIMVISDHIAPVTDVDFTREDDSIITTATDGAVYSWRLRSNQRISEYVCKNATATSISISKTEKNKRSIIVSFERNKDTVPLVTDIIKKRRQTNFAMRKINRSQTGLSQTSVLSDPMLTDNHMLEYKAPLADLYSDSQSQPTKNEKKSTLKDNFIAIWENEVNPNPNIVHFDCPVKSIAMGKTYGPDGFEICILGLKDGRMIISFLPLPIIEITSTILSKSLTTVPSTKSPTTTNRKKSIMKKYSISSAKDGINKDISIPSINTEKSNNIRFSVYSNASTPKSLGSVDKSEDSNAEIYNREEAEEEILRSLDLGKCKVRRFHVGSINFVGISTNGKWIFSAGADGCIYLFSCFSMDHQNSTSKENEKSSTKLLIMDSGKLSSIKNKLKDLEYAIQQSRKENQQEISKIIESKEKLTRELEEKMRKEILAREKTIIQTREDYLNLKASLQSEIDSIQGECNRNINEMEVMYEKKFAQESLYLDKMKQVYDEYVVNSRFDIEDLRLKYDQKLKKIEEEKNLIMEDAEKQKNEVLKYFEFLKFRNGEILDSLEDRQTEERIKLKEELEKANKMLAKIQSQSLSNEVQATRTIQKLNSEIDNKEVEVLRLKSDIEWANERIMKLEFNLQQATTELNQKNEITSQWESKTGEMQQKIIELERLRKTLTSQLHLLRQELSPKEEELIKITEKLKEVDREYELSLHALSEKEKLLFHKSENLNLLQKQVRELRNSGSRKDGILRRAATLLNEYNFALQRAYFSSEKRTINNKTNNIVTHSNENEPLLENSNEKKKKSNQSNELEVVEIISENKEMKIALKRLNDILTPFLNENNVDLDINDEAEAVRREQERHMNQLYRNVSGLKANLEVLQVVADTKVQNHLKDNKVLLKEVNSLRTEIRNLSMENQRLQAQIDFDIHKKNSAQKNQEKYNNDRFDSNQSPRLQNYQSELSLKDQNSWAEKNSDWPTMKDKDVITQPRKDNINLKTINRSHTSVLIEDSFSSAQPTDHSGRKTKKEQLSDKKKENSNFDEKILEIIKLNEREIKSLLSEKDQKAPKNNQAEKFTFKPDSGKGMKLSKTTNSLIDSKSKKKSNNAQLVFPAVKSAAKL